MVLLSIVKKIRRREMEMRVLILGLDCSGKTTILQRINGEDYTKVAPTFGFNIKTLEFREWKLNCWDIGGQSSLRSYWRNYFEQTDAVVWVVDSTDKKRLKDCRAELDKLLGEECLKGVTLLVLANKRDLPNALTADQIRDELKLEEIKNHHWKIFNSSAYTGENLIEAFEWMCKDVSSRVLVRE
ncbi:ADP-ribosylation factor-like protein 2 isoform X1 [Aphelenchoides besseyi]|nr:ADP-ribosylation factor-like protein 2 isoform X1 [Aphelenchoides besseyi]KAI6228296.1 ADP-ribosylation factor-like protein 2 isoform X1 [Aphelenchoides besseyi]